MTWKYQKVPEIGYENQYELTGKMGGIDIQRRDLSLFRPVVLDCSTEIAGESSVEELATIAS